MRLSDFKILTFDCYGTLIDWETGIVAALEPFLAGHGRTAARDDLLENFARYESAQEAETPGLLYSELLAAVHRRLCIEWGITARDEDHHAFGGSVGDWPAFSDTPAALSYLSRFYKLVILSNVDRVSFARSRRRLGVEFDAIYTAEDIGSYKPDLGNFRYMIAELAKAGHPATDILHTAQSLYHDHMPANALGLHSVWIDRRAGAAGGGATPTPPPGVHWDFRFTSMAEFVEAHRHEIAG